MGALKGSITYSKFRVEGSLPDDLHTRYMARIRTRMFKALTPEDEGDVAVGWVPIERPFDDEISFRSDGVFFGSYVNLALRMDRWKFPSSLIKAKMAAAERTWRAKTGKERISRAEKAELRDAVERKLRRDGVPVTKTIDLSWNTATQELRLFGRSKVIAEHFHELFEKTFSLRLVVASPYTTGLAVGVSKRALEHVEPTAFHTGVEA
ncbi:MAG: hypothetical protein ACXVEF_16840 [Polyangiales bacterium]